MNRATTRGRFSAKTFEPPLPFHNNPPANVQTHMTRKVILIAEDCADDVFLLERAFDRAGPIPRFTQAKNGAEAISYLAGKDQFADRAAHPFPGLLLLDLKMP